MEFVKIYHSLWDYDLKFNAFQVYCALLKFANTSTGYANVCNRKIAAAAGLSESSVSRGVEELRKKGLVKVVDRRWQGHRLANGYLLCPLSGRFTKLPLWALSLPVKASGFKLYCYLLKCADKHNRAFPSLSGIKKAVGCTIQTVVTQIKALVSLGLIHKRTHIKKNNAFGHNQYRIVTFENITGNPKAGKEKTRPVSVFPHKNAKVVNNNFRILKICLFVKTVICYFAILIADRGQTAFSIFQGYSNPDKTSTRPISLYRRIKKNKPYLQYFSKQE